MKAVFDTNILIDYLNGVQRAATEIERCSSPVISIISWMEVMAGVKDSPHEMLTRSFLRKFSTQDITSEVAEEAVSIQAGRRIKLPDAIVLATARVHRCSLVTRNTKDFPGNDPDICVPYKL